MTVPCSQLILLAPAKLESGLPLCLFPWVFFTRTFWQPHIYFTVLITSAPHRLWSHIMRDVSKWKCLLLSAGANRRVMDTPPLRPFSFYLEMTWHTFINCLTSDTHAHTETQTDNRKQPAVQHIPRGDRYSRYSTLHFLFTLSKILPLLFIKRYTNTEKMCRMCISSSMCVGWYLSVLICAPHRNVLSNCSKTVKFCDVDCNRRSLEESLDSLRLCLSVCGSMWPHLQSLS